MFKVLKITGPDLMTDKGGICIVPFAFADGGKTHPVSQEDWRKMRDLFIAGPDMLAALVEIDRLTDNIAVHPDARNWVSTVNALARSAIAKAEPKVNEKGE